MAPLLEVEDLWVYFSILGKSFPAVRGISFQIEEGETVGIVGESGCGKTAAIRAINGLSPGSLSGKVLFEGEEIKKPHKKIGMVFQDPMTFLNPTMKIGVQIKEALIYRKIANEEEATDRAIELLSLVGVPDPVCRIEQYPHQQSGGIRQRILLAIALACLPRLLIADEPTTALDTTIQTQILDLIRDLQRRFQMSLLLISHDFQVIRSICKRVLVMYAGKIVESGTVEEITRFPRHPYTQMLIHSIPDFHYPRSQPLPVISGAPPHPFALKKGCAFKERCPYAANKCNEEPIGTVACWRVCD